MINRKLSKIIKDRLFEGKIIILLGPRQAGKTTLVRDLVVNSGTPYRWFNGDEPDDRELLSNKTSSHLRATIGDKQLVVIDEAQRVENIGLTLKLMNDNFPQIQVIATGSSSLELANTLNEALTGRKYEFHLFPVSYLEMVENYGQVETRRLLEHRILYGFYPEIITREGREQELLSLLSGSYLYKDLLAWKQIKKPAVLEKLVQALALQIGNEVSCNELGQLIGLDTETVERYIDLLEKAYVLFRLPSLSRNMRNELKKGRKIYFYDTGIRNAVIKNFNPLSMRQDTGFLWENFLVAERTKFNHYNTNYVNQFFWRTHAQQEIDYIEEYQGILHAYEFKWNVHKKRRFPDTFLTAYPGSETKVISLDNFEQFIT